MQIHSRKKRFKERTTDAMAAARQLLQRIVERTLDPWEGHQQVVAIFQGHAHLQMPELRAFVRIDGIDQTDAYQSRLNCAIRLFDVQRHSLGRKELLPSGESGERTIVSDKSRFQSKSTANGSSPRFGCRTIDVRTVPESERSGCVRQRFLDVERKIIDMQRVFRDGDQIIPAFTVNQVGVERE